MERLLELVDAVDAGSLDEREFADVKSSYPKFYEKITNCRSEYTREFVASLVNAQSMEERGVLVWNHVNPHMPVPASIASDAKMNAEAREQCGRLASKVNQRS